LCANLLKGYVAVEREITSLRQTSRNDIADPCPPDHLWLEFVAGVAPKEQEAHLLTHASQCTTCAARLDKVQAYFQELPEDVTQVPSFDLEWQQGIAKKMAESGPSPTVWDKGTRSRRFWFWAPLTAATVLAAVFGVTWLVNIASAPSIDQQLGQAYSQNRTVVLRIPSAGYAPFRGQLGSSQSLLSPNTSHRNAAEQAIRSACRNKSDETQCLLWEARLNLLDLRYRAAFTALDGIQGKPESHDLLLNRAIALFEEATAGTDVKSPESLYAQAAEELSKVLKQSPNDPVALFDRALIYEKLQMMQSASADWQALLKVEKDAGWRNEAKAHLDDIDRKKKPER